MWVQSVTSILSVSGAGLRYVMWSLSAVALAACGGEPALRIVLEADLSGLSEMEGKKVTDGAINVIDSRLGAKRLTDRTITQQGSQRIVVRVRGVTDVSEITRLVSQTQSIRTDTDRLEFMRRTCSDAGCATYTDESTTLTGNHVLRAYAGVHSHSGRPIVTIELTPIGARLFARLTSDLAGTPNRIAVFLNEEELISPSVRRPITSGLVLLEGGGFTSARVNTLAGQLDFGVLPVPLTVVESEMISD